MNITHLLSEAPVNGISVIATEAKLAGGIAQPVVAIMQNGETLMRLGLEDLKRLELARLEAYHSNTIPDFE